MHITKLCQSEKATYCMSPIRYSRNGKTVERVKRSMVARNVREVGMNTQNIGHSQGGENVLYDITMVDSCHYIFVKTNRTHSTKNELTLCTLGDNDVSVLIH